VSSCHDLEAFLAERASGEVTPVDQARLDAHLPTCERCRALLASYEEVLDLARLPRPVPSSLATGFLLNPDLGRSTLGRLRVRQRRHRMAFAGSLGMAAAAALVLAVSLHLTPPRAVPGSDAQHVAANWEPDVEGALEASGVEDADSQDDFGSGETEMALLAPSDLP